MKKQQLLRFDEIEKRVFTRWINCKLKQFNKFVTDIQQDLTNGLVLADLIEILSHQKINQINLTIDQIETRIYNINQIIIFLKTLNISINDIGNDIVILYHNLFTFLQNRLISSMDL